MCVNEHAFRRIKMTVNEIARLAGVSTGTVDRVLHNRGRVSEKTRAKVSRIIKKNGYRPDPIARFLKKKGDYKIGVLIPSVSEESGYWAEIYDGILNTCVNDYATFGMSVQLYEFQRPDRKSLDAQFRKMLDSDCAAYIIAPVMQEEILFLLSENRPKVPYCFIDSTVPGAEPLCSATQNPFNAGYLAAKLTRLFASDDGTFAVIKPFSESFNLNERSRGFSSYFLEQKNSRGVQHIARGASRKNIYESVDELVRDYKDLKGICVVNSESHFAGKRLAALGLKDRIAVTGFDLVPENKKAIQKNEIDCLISQNPEEQGALILKEIYKRLVLETETQSEINIPLSIFFKENVE